MMALVNRALVWFIPYLPKAFAARFAGRYVAGESVQEALSVARDLNDRGFEVTLDILGEHVATSQEASDVTQAYVHLYGELAAGGIKGNISVKPTHLGLDLSADLCRENFGLLLDAAREHDNFLRIDMESSRQTDETLELYRDLAARYRQVGPVLQAYLRRSSGDLAQLTGEPFNFRLCKGIYLESADIAFNDPGEINRNFIALLRQGLEGGAYVAIATHDQRLISASLDLIKELDADQARLEFQVLYGVPMQGRLEQLLKAGHKVRVYVPFGEEWYDYGLRRLKENPAIAGYILKNIFHRAS